MKRRMMERWNDRIGPEAAKRYWIYNRHILTIFGLGMTWFILIGLGVKFHIMLVWGVGLIVLAYDLIAIVILQRRALKITCRETSKALAIDIRSMPPIQDYKYVHWCKMHGLQPYPFRKSMKE